MRTVLSSEKLNVVEAEALRTAAGNMCGTALRGTVAPPESETSSSRQGSCRNLGGLLSPAAALAVPGRIGKLERATPIRKTGGFCQLSGQKHKMLGFFGIPNKQDIVFCPES